MYGLYSRAAYDGARTVNLIGSFQNYISTQKQTISHTFNSQQIINQFHIEIRIGIRNVNLFT